MVPMSHYLQKWTQNRSKSLLFKTGKLWLEEEAAGRKDKGSDFSGWYLQSTGNKSKMWKTGLQMAPKHKASEQEWKSSSETKKERWQTLCQLLVCIQRISQCLTAENIVSMSYWLHLCYPFPAVGGWVSSGLKEDVRSWWSKRRRRFTQSGGESGWLPAPLIEKRLHILYCRAAQRIKWRRRACKLGCGLRSGI